jgi:hypothetical protein
VKRRTVLKSLAAVVAVPALSELQLVAQGPSLSDADIATLKAIAEVVLPTALGQSGRDKAVARFVAWIRNYKDGADRGHSYGASTLAAASGPSPAARYPAQFAALDKSARDQGAASLAALPLDARRTLVESALNVPQPLNRLPARPTGANLVADFAGYYFNSADAFDLAYDADIGRDSCRSLEGSENAPAKLSRGALESWSLGASSSSTAPRLQGSKARR